MRAATSVSEFVEAPAGAVFAQRTFLICAPSRARIAIAHIASMDPSETPLVSDLLRLPGTHGLDPRYDILYDVGAVELMTRESFTLFEGFVRATIDVVAARTRRFAMLRPPGLSGHMFSGMFHDWLVPRLAEVRMFTERDAALTWLEFPADERAATEQALDAFMHTSPLVRRMREALTLDLQAPSLQTIAAKLLTSPRSLQRHLAELGITFRDEVARARIQAAQSLLVTSDDKIETIASSLGFRSAAAFTRMFREAVGTTPAAFRDRHRS